MPPLQSCRAWCAPLFAHVTALNWGDVTRLGTIGRMTWLICFMQQAIRHTRTRHLQDYGLVVCLYMSIKTPSL